jgi:hypothetical protein
VAPDLAAVAAVAATVPRTAVVAGSEVVPGVREETLGPAALLAASVGNADANSASVFDLQSGDLVKRLGLTSSVTDGCRGDAPNKLSQTSVIRHMSKP